MGLRGGETPLAIQSPPPAKRVTFPGVFFIDVIYFQKAPHYDPLVAVIVVWSQVSGSDR